jgi:hypothetical protein
MFIDPLTFLVAHRRAKDANLSSSETLKATLLGSAVGGGNIATSVFFADHTIKRKIEVSRPIVTEPASCMDSLVSSIEIFLACMEQDKDNADKLGEYRKVFRKLGKHLVTSPERKQAIIKRLEMITADPAGSEPAKPSDTKTPGS